MACFSSNSLFLLLTLLISNFFTSNAIFIEHFPETLQTKRMEKISHLHFFFHDTLSGKNPSSIKIAGPPKGSFGMTMMMDDPLTEGPKPNSKLLGRAQGLYALASQNDAALLMIMNYVFVEGKYNGSSLSVLGRNHVFDTVREMPVIGGSGLFRFARGYAMAHTVWFDTNSGDAVVEYNVTVLHF